MGDLVCGDLDPGVGLDCFGDLFIAAALAAKRLNLVGDHADEGFDRKLFRLKASHITEGFLRTKRLLQWVHFAHVIFSGSGLLHQGDGLRYGEVVGHAHKVAVFGVLVLRDGFEEDDSAIDGGIHLCGLPVGLSEVIARG